MKAYIVAAVCVALLAGCSPDAGEPLASAISATPSVTPTLELPPATASSSLTLSELVLSSDGIGPIRMGEAVPADSAVAQLDPAYCDINHPDSGHGGWVPNYPPTPDNGNHVFFLESAESAVDSPVIWITVGSDEIRTAGGLGVGSTIAELEAFYGIAIESIQTDMATAHVVQGTSGQLVFWGTDSVDGVEVIALDAEPVFNYTLMCH